MPGFQSTQLVTEGTLEPFFFLYADDSIQGNPETCKQSSVMLNYEVKNTKRTDASHLPYPVYVPETVQSTMEKAGKIGKSVSTVVNRLYDNAKVKEQALLDVKSILAISSIYGEETLEEACRQALKDYYMITYNTVIPYVKKISKNEKNNKNALENRHSQNVGIVRGADYYKKGGK